MNITRLFGIDRANTGVLSPWSDRAALEAAVFSHLHDLDMDTVPPTRGDAMAVGSVARGRNLIAGTIARLPLVAMRGTSPHPEQPALLQQPEHGRARYLTLVWTVDMLIFYGRAFWHVVERDSTNTAKRVRFVPEWQARVNAEGNLTHVNDRPVNPADTIRFDAHHEGLLAYAGVAIRTANRLNRAALVASANPVPSVELHQTGGTPLSLKEASDFVAHYVAQRQKHGVSYTSQSIETKTHGASPEQLLIDGRKAAALEIARAMGLPAWAVDAPTEGSSLTYSNVPSRARELIDYALAPYMECITARLSLDDILPRGTWARFNTDSLLIEAFPERMAAYKTAIDTGVYTIEDLQRRELGTPLEPNGETK